jgi:hypothetical protein
MGIVLLKMNYRLIMIYVLKYVFLGALPYFGISLSSFFVSYFM